MPSIADLPQAEQDDLMSLAINPISSLKQKYIDQLRENSKDLLEAYNYPEYITCDIELLRFVRGHMFDMKEATDAFRKMLIWRKENKIDEYFKKVEEVGFDVHKIPYADIYESVYHTNYHHKVDKEGFLIDIRMLGSIDVKAVLTHSLKEWIDYNIYVLEWRIYILNNKSKETGRLQRLFCIQDLKGVGMHMVSPTLISYFKEMTNVTSHNYPETMHKSFITNAPAIFSSLWGIAKPIMHPRTVKKFTILKSDYNEELYKYIDIQNIPVVLGGICHCPDNCLSGIPNDDKFHIYVSKKTTIPVHLHANQKITWNWKLESGSIDAVVRFDDTEVFKGEKIDQHASEYTCQKDGTMYFLFDNSFSWINGKTVVGMIDLSE